jgi:acyl-CoA synthetase (AMP-forming)/AMP-acid ligase II
MPAGDGPRVSEIVERFERLRRDTPRRPLIHLPALRTTITAEALWEAAVEQRSQLERRGVGPESLAIYGAGNRADIFACWLACRSLGAALLPVDAGTTAPEIAAIARRFHASVAILSPSAPGAPEIGHPEPYGPDLMFVRPRHAAEGPAEHRGAAVLKLTSGSTGLPKATFTTEAQLIDDSHHIMSAMDIRADDCQMAAIPLSHAYGIGNLVIPLLIAGTSVVLREGFVPHQFVSDALTYGARIFPGVPFMFDHFNDHFPPGAWPAGLETLISAGARLETSTAGSFFSSFGVKIHSFYGTSETGGITYDDSPEILEPPTVGRPMPGVTISLRPEEGIPMVGGRVHVAGEAVASGYVGEERDAAFTGGGFLTGDFGHVTDRGHLVLTGRISAFINVAGRKVLPQEVEDVIRSMPGVADARVLGAPDRARGQRIVACIVPDTETPDTLSVRRFCAARLAPYKIPRTIIALDRIPLTERGKTDQRRLELMVAEHLRTASGTGVL